MTSDFNPNRLSFEEGLARIQVATKEAGLCSNEIVTSRDDAALKARRLLEVSNIPSGFRKWQLPVHLGRPSQLYVTVAQPEARVEEHSHDEGDGIRFIAGGSIIYDGKELTAGDWMYIPKGLPYSMEVGLQGAIMCYCYCCSCA